MYVSVWIVTADTHMICGSVPYLYFNVDIHYDHFQINVIAFYILNTNAIHWLYFSSVHVIFLFIEMEEGRSTMVS